MQGKNKSTNSGYRSKIPRFQSNNESLPLIMSTAYKERHRLYLMHFCFAFVSKMWEMGIVFCLADLSNSSLYIVALSGFISSMSLCVFMSPIGHYLDHINRMTAVQFCLVIKVIVVTIAYLICSFLTQTTIVTASISQQIL